MFRFINSSKCKDLVAKVISFLRRVVSPVHVTTPKGQDVFISVLVDVDCNVHVQFTTTLLSGRRAVMCMFTAFYSTWDEAVVRDGIARSPVNFRASEDLANFAFLHHGRGRAVHDTQAMR